MFVCCILCISQCVERWKYLDIHGSFTNNCIYWIYPSVLVRIPQRPRTSKQQVISKWLMQLWRLASLKSAEMMSQLQAHQAEEMSLTQAKVRHFALLRPSTDWIRPTPTEDGSLLYSAYQLKCYSHPKASSQKHPACLTRSSSTLWPNQVGTWKQPYR